MHRRTAPTRTTAAAAVAALALALSGGSGDAAVARPAPAAVEATTTATPTASPAPVTASPLPTASPVAPALGGTASPSPAGDPPASPTYDVVEVQRRLQGLRYYGGELDGRSGPAMRSAVMAFQKVNGLTVDGAVGPQTLAALAAPRAPRLQLVSPADRVEVDLDRQVLHVVRDGAIVRTMPVSSGNGERYARKSGGTARALTPVGTYRVQRRIVGVRHADLGQLYDPQYFHEGWAIHGSNSVPAHPASHGCVRVTRADAKYLLDAIDVGTTVHLYGGQHVFVPAQR